MRILIRTSKWAIWARRLGSVAVPLVVLSVVLHRYQVVVGDGFLAAIATAVIVAMLAILTAIVAIARLWQSGDQGWSKALLGFLLGAMCLAPIAFYGSLALKFPPVTDIATTDRGALPLVFEPGTAAMPPPVTLSAAQIAVYFPGVETRDYPLGQAQTFELVRRLVVENGWEIRRQQDPTGLGGAAFINAQVMTIPGWREEIVLRVLGDAGNSVVDMRSVSLNARHDLGSNGQRIEQLLAALDDAVMTLLRDTPSVNVPLEEESAPVVEPQQN